MKGKRAASDRLLIIGDQMANLCFNLAQRRADVSLEPQLRDTMRECQKAWDEERLACADLERKTKAGKKSK